MDTVVLANIDIEKFNGNEMCIINERGINEHGGKMIRDRICHGETTLICQICKVD
jgi:hypothetical protein